MKSDLQILVTNQAGVTVVKISGEVRLDDDAEELHTVQDMHPQKVVIDASDLAFLASVGMRILINFQRSITAYGGTVRIAGLRPTIRKALQEAKLLPLFDLRPDVASAMT